MKNYNYWNRLKKACEFRKLDVSAMSDLVDIVRKRASGDRHVADVFFPLMRVLEPSGCQMPHCESHTSYGFCGCGQCLVPSRCKKHKEFLQRQYDRMEKVYLEGRIFFKSAAKPIKFECPYAQYGNSIGNKNKYQLFRQGAEDEHKKLPMRSMSTWKLKLEWNIPTDETIEDYFYFEEYSEARAIAEKFEILRFDIMKYYDWSYPDKRIGQVYFIAKITPGCGWKNNAKALRKPKPNEVTG